MKNGEVSLTPKFYVGHAGASAERMRTKRLLAQTMRRCVPAAGKLGVQFADGLERPPIPEYMEPTGNPMPEFSGAQTYFRVTRPDTPPAIDPFNCSQLQSS